MKLLIIILFFILLSILGCEKQVCYECKQHYEIMAVWDITGEPLMMVSGYPRIKDSTFVFCDVTLQDIQKIETIGSKDKFWIKFGDLYLETILTTKCEER